MSSLLTATVVFAGIAVSEVALGFAVIAIILAWAALVGLWIWGKRHPALERLPENPVLEPVAEHWWENEAVFNPAAFVDGGRVHLLYRALGSDGISRIGYASSKDGIHFDERLSYPVYAPTRGWGIPRPGHRWGPLSYSTDAYASGGGWGGSEDPRVVKIEDRCYMTFTAFDGWGFLRMALTSIGAEHLLNKNWTWSNIRFLSPPGEIQKNWVLFPDKINGRFAILHSLSPEVRIEYVDELSEFDGTKFINGSSRSGGRPGHWDAIVRGAGAPPIKTPHGWLLFYHGFDPARHDSGYKVGAMLLDLDDPTKILHRSSQPVLEAKEWYENDGKPGVTYASGAVIFGDDLIVYYGGGDKRVAAARTDFKEFVRQLANDESPKLSKVVG